MGRHAKKIPNRKPTSVLVVISGSVLFSSKTKRMAKQPIHVCNHNNNNQNFKWIMTTVNAHHNTKYNACFTAERTVLCGEHLWRFLCFYAFSTWFAIFFLIHICSRGNYPYADWSAERKWRRSKKRTPPHRAMEINSTIKKYINRL